MKFRLMSTALAVSLLLAACGGGGGGKSTDAGGSNATLSGTAAAGLPLVGSVTVKDATGATRTVSIGANGAYTVDVSGLTGPFLLRATGTAGGATYVVHSAATSADVNGNINITPLTDLILSNVAGQIATNYFDSGSFSSLSATQLSTETAKLKEKLLPVLQAMGVDTATDLLRTQFTPLDSALDKALDAISVSYDTSTNIATLTNVLTQESITDDIATPAAQEPSPTTMSDTSNLVTAADDIPLIRAALASFTAAFSSSLPTAATIKSHLTSGFLDLDQDRNAMASEMAGDSSNIGIQLTEVTINHIDYTDTASPVADVSFLVKNASGAVLDREQHFKLKKVSGTWKLHGNQRVLDISAHVHTVKSHYSSGDFTSECRGSGLEFWIEDMDDANSADIAHIVVTGPGLPGNGIRYDRPSEGGPWQMVETGQSGTWYRLAATCEGYSSAGLSDEQIAAIKDNASYTLTMYDSEDEVITAQGDNGVYRMSMAARPLTQTELSTSTAFPSITSPATFAAFLSSAFTDPVIAGGNMNPQGEGWVYVAATYGGSGELSAESNVTSSANGTFSRTFSLPAGSGELYRKEIRVETRDAGLRHLMTNYVQQLALP